MEQVLSWQIHQKIKPSGHSRADSGRMWFSCHADSGLLLHASGAIIDWVETALKCHECRIFRRMLHLFDQSDVVLGDRGFCSYANLALLVERGAHAVMRAHQMRQLDYRQGKVSALTIALLRGYGRQLLVRVGAGMIGMPAEAAQAAYRAYQSRDTGLSSASI